MKKRKQVGYPNIRAEIAREGITHEEAAMRMGVTPVTLSSWINGKHKPDVEAAKAAAKAMGCTVEYLFA